MISRTIVLATEWQHYRDHFIISKNPHSLRLAVSNADMPSTNVSLTLVLAYLLTVGAASVHHQAEQAAIERVQDVPGLVVGSQFAPGDVAALLAEGQNFNAKTDENHVLISQLKIGPDSAAKHDKMLEGK